ncbi:MAG: hypothetical protein N4A33_11935 [Bacteriovoracaceae bacterium]|nr:hypothetical protein [Bacteriovoracaceae bacterium]
MFDPIRGYRFFAIAKGYEISSDRLEQIKSFHKRGAFMQVESSYIEELELSEEQNAYLMQLNKDQLDLENALKEAKEELTAKNVEPFVLSQKFLECVTENNFSPLISRCLLEVSAFDTHINKYRSCLIEICKKALIRDSLINRCTILSYFVAKRCKIYDQLELLEILVASLLKDLGISQISHEIKYDENDKEYIKHPILSEHILKKAPLSFSKELIRYIKEHHELADGSGFPQKKKSTHIHFNSQIIGLCDHVLTYSQGKITGKKVDLKIILNALRENKSLSSLNTQYDENIVAALCSLQP